MTDRDLTVRATAQGLEPNQPVEEFMTKRPVTIQGSDDLLDAFVPLRQVGVRRLPVLEDSDVAGTVTVDDLLVWMVGELAAIATPVADIVLPGRR